MKPFEYRRHLRVSFPFPYLWKREQFYAPKKPFWGGYVDFWNLLCNNNTDQTML